MWVTYVVLLFYFAILFAIGIAASRKVKGIKDFFVGGKDLGFWAVAFSARATGESAWLLIGLTGMGALMGVSAFWVLLGEVLGVGICWWFMAKPFKRMSDTYESITIPDYLVSRFKPTSHLLRIIAATALSIFVVIYVSAQIDATGKAFESFLEWNYYTGAIVGFIIVLFYSFIGGFVAVVWSDLFQGVLMFLGMVVLPIVGFIALGDVNLFDGLEKIDPALLNTWGPGGFNTSNVLTIMGLLFIGLGFLGSPQIFVRFMSVRNEAEIDKGKWVALAFTLFADSGAIIIGMLGRYFFTQMGDDPTAILNTGAEDVLIMTVRHLLPMVFIAIYIAVVLSAIMSTIDSLLVVAASALLRDFYQKIFKPHMPDEAMGNLSRWITLALALFALAIAMVVAITTPDRTIFWFVIFGWSGIAATFCPVMILSIFWKEYNQYGAITSMIVGFACVPFFKFVIGNTESMGHIIAKLDVLAPSFVLSMLAGFIATKISLKNSKALA